MLILLTVYQLAVYVIVPQKQSLSADAASLVLFGNCTQ